MSGENRDGTGSRRSSSSSEEGQEPAAAAAAATTRPPIQQRPVHRIRVRTQEEVARAQALSDLGEDLTNGFEGVPPGLDISDPELHRRIQLQRRQQELQRQRDRLMSNESFDSLFGPVETELRDFEAQQNLEKSEENYARGLAAHGATHLKRTVVDAFEENPTTIRKGEPSPAAAAAGDGHNRVHPGVGRDGDDHRSLRRQVSDTSQSIKTNLGQAAKITKNTLAPAGRVVTQGVGRALDTMADGARHIPVLGMIEGQFAKGALVAADGAKSAAKKVGQAAKAVDSAFIHPNKTRRLSSTEAGRDRDPFQQERNRQQLRQRQPSQASLDEFCLPGAAEYGLTQEELDHLPPDHSNPYRPETPSEHEWSEEEDMFLDEPVPLPYPPAAAAAPVPAPPALMPAAVAPVPVPPNVLQQAALIGGQLAQQGMVQQQNGNSPPPPPQQQQAAPGRDG